MHNLEDEIEEWRNAMRATLPHKPQIIDELEDHLREGVARLTKNGVPPAQAFAHARDKIGSPRDLAAQFQKIEPKMKKLKRALRIAFSAVVGVYLAMMAFHFIAVSLYHLRNGISPFSQQGHRAFFTSLIACLGCSIVLWLMWRKTTRRHDANSQS